MHEAGERPDHDQQPAADRVQLVAQRHGGAGHQRGVGVEQEEAAEPGRDRLAVVVAALDQVVDRGVPHPGEDHEARAAP